MWNWRKNKTSNSFLIIIGKFECKIKFDYQIAHFESLYQWQLNNRPNDKKFILHDGPPYANGDIHIGHMVNKVNNQKNIPYEKINKQF